MNLTKYSASGNDFLIFHAFAKKNRSEIARKVCHRQNGIGADGLIVIIPHKNLDFEWEFYNSDGSVASMCGNGTRAAGLYAFENDLAPRKMRFLSGAGEIGVEVFDDGAVESELTKPKYIDDNIDGFGKKWQLIDTGVLHLVTLDQNLDILKKDELRALRVKHNANVNIGKVDGEILRIRTFERGVEDETLACGTGMAALFLHAKEKKVISTDMVKVIPASKEVLELRVDKTNLFFKGRVKRLFSTIPNSEIFV